jgi:hypothetical protein
MRVIVGTSGTGKTFLLAQEALESSKEKRVLVYASNPKDMFQKLGMVAGTDKLNSITVVKVKDTREVIKHLMYNKSVYDAVFVDTDDIAKDNTAYYKLLGFSIGGAVDLTISWQANLNGDGKRVTLYSQEVGEELIKITEYSRKDIQEKIKSWTASE